MGNYMKNPIHGNMTVNHGKSREKPNSQNVIQSKSKLQEKPNIQDVIQPNSKSWEIEGKPKFMGCDPIQQEIKN